MSEALQKQREERRGQLQKLADARRKNPFRKKIGTVTEVETTDGRVLAEREEAVGVARGGTAGAVGSSADKIGPMVLTSDARRAIANRTSVATTTPENLGLQNGLSPKDKKEFEDSFTKSNPPKVPFQPIPVPGVDNNEIRVVTGRFGTAVGGLSIKDQLVSQGKLSKDFELTPEQRTGQAPLPKEYDAMKQELLNNAATVAKDKGTVSDPGTRAVMRGVGPQGVAAIDTATAKAVADQKMVRDSKASDATLRSIYSSAQMDDLDKTIIKANKSKVPGGAVVYPKADGTFGIKEKPLDTNTQEGRDLTADRELTKHKKAGGRRDQQATYQQQQPQADRDGLKFNKEAEEAREGFMAEALRSVESQGIGTKKQAPAYIKAQLAKSNKMWKGRRGR